MKAEVQELEVQKIVTCKERKIVLELSVEEATVIAVAIGNIDFEKSLFFSGELQKYTHQLHYRDLPRQCRLRAAAVRDLAEKIFFPVLGILLGIKDES